MKKIMIVITVCFSLPHFVYSFVDRNEPQYLSSIGYVQEIIINFNATLRSGQKFYYIGSSVPESLQGVVKSTSCFLSNREDKPLSLNKGDRVIPGFYGPIHFTDLDILHSLDDPAWKVNILGLHERTNQYINLSCNTTHADSDKPTLEEVRYNFESVANVTFTKYGQRQIPTSYLQRFQGKKTGFGRVSDFGSVESFLYNMCGKLDGSATLRIGEDRTASVRRDCLKLVPSARHLNASAVEICSQEPRSFYRMRSENIISCLEDLVEATF